MRASSQRCFENAPVLDARRAVGVRSPASDDRSPRRHGHVFRSPPVGQAQQLHSGAAIQD
ncbi:MAG: hypothetical protein AVDCRST_MAG71-2296 [uncultured Lysobacter sp.]|uniref:Uncharacterized protein n=1 Tax=uncultured Lysobacter sp. TaxID=271060 RepID=A0A6J4LTB1_9GAMM|nr:MAG: hypothetical protein AVDCRST_MAG71-2296 [uncultured Lysobacter sp.]